MSLTIRPAVDGDVAALAELAALTFPLACPPSTTAADQATFVAAHLSPDRFAQYLADPLRTVLVADDGARLVGYAMTVAGEPADPQVARAVRLRPTLELSKCYVHPDRHGTGASAQLMAAALAVARASGSASVWLGVNQENERARRFYAKQGFEVAGTKHFVVGSRTEDDFVMERAVG